VSKSRWLQRAGAAALVIASVAVGTTAPAQAMASWSGQIQGLFGVSWEAPGYLGARVTQSLNPPGTVQTGDFLWAPVLYPGNESCIELLTSYHSNGSVVIQPKNWCDGDPWGPYWVVDAAFRDKYVRVGAYTTKIEQTNATTNEWKALLFNYNTSSWDVLYTKAGVHSGGPSAGWNYFEVFTGYNAQTGVGDYCDRTAGYTFASKYLYFKVGTGWIPATGTNTNLVGDGDPANSGCPGLTFQRGPGTAWSVTNPPLGCNVHAVSATGSGGTFTLAVQLFNTNAYKINGWKLDITLNGNQTATGAVNGSFTQNGDVVTFTNSTTNRTVNASGGSVTFLLSGTYTGTNTLPTSFKLDTGYTPNTCTVV
jgi:hypothetical protein